MAGIGFEINKLFERKGMLSAVYAYSAATIVFAGPFLLGMALIFTVRVVSEMGNAILYEKDFLVSIITYAVLASIVVSNIFSNITARYAADMLYTGKPQRILPAMHGSIALQLLFGLITYGPFMAVSGAGLIYGVLGFLLFGELIVVWTLIAFISAAKDYMRIIAMFFIGITSAAVCAFLLVFLIKTDVIASVLVSVCMGYGVMAVGYYSILKQFFPVSEKKCFRFIEYFFTNPQISFIGIFMAFGLLSHYIVVWLSPFGSQIKGLFYCAPFYDIPAIFAFISTLATTVSFSANTEVHFYPSYKSYFDLLNNDGSAKSIELAEKDMLTTMKREFMYLALKQFIITLLMCTVGSLLIQTLEFAAFNTATRGLFRVLCVGYGIFAVGNVLIIFLLYYSDYLSALISSFLFAAFTIGFTVFFSFRSYNLAFCGYGFCCGAIVLYLSASFLLLRFTSKIRCRVFTRQSFFKTDSHGFLYNMLKGLWQ